VVERRWKVGGLALALASFGCRQSGVECTPPPPTLVCPEAGAPSFEGDVLPIFKNICNNCHAPGQVEANKPLTNYQQIYGRRGAVFTQVFENCYMPPSIATVKLTDDERQMLLDWYACGTPDSPAVDASTGD
jgi:hypothetical protein